MLTDTETALIYKGACVPEQLPHYVESISGQTAHLHEGYVVYTRETRLTFIGYPVVPDAADLKTACKTACRRFRPDTLWVIASDLSFLRPSPQSLTSDDYFRLDLPCPPLGKKRAGMIRRAAREVSVSWGTWRPEHEELVAAFIRARKIDAAYAQIFARIPDYLAAAESACLLEARKGAALAAFTVADFGSADYAFYMFHFRSQNDFVPGAGDLLLRALAETAAQKGKQALNLGLGINEGNRRFKQHWGGVPFLKYMSAAIEPPGARWRAIGRMVREMAEGRHPEKKT